MESIARRVAREAKAVTRKEVIVRAIEGRLTWIQAADVLGISARQLRRRWERHGYDGLVDGRHGAKGIPVRAALAHCGGSAMRVVAELTPTIRTATQLRGGIIL